MGSLTNRGGRWTARIRRQGHPTQTRTFDRKVEALAWVREVEVRLDKGELLPQLKPDAHPFGQALARYRDAVSSEKKGKRQEGYRLAQLATTWLAALDMTEISGVEIARWRDERGRRCAPATVLRELQLISHVFVVARSEWGYPVTNPVAEIRRPRVRNQRDVRISPEVIVRIAAELNPEMGAIVRFAVETGMRRSEILGMRWSWVRDSIVWIPDTKSGVARGVPLSQTAQELLAGLVRLPGGKVWSCQGDSITHAFKRSAVRVGHGELRFHDLRHEAISRWFERGFHVMEVQLMSGHKTLPMLMRYTHLRPESLVGRI